MSRRPPFENRWTSGRKAWRWHQELEALGIENARLRLALQDTPKPPGFPDPEIPEGFIRDWLRYHDRKARLEPRRWLLMAALLTAVAASAAIISAWPAIVRVLWSGLG